MWRSAPELIAVVKDLPQKEALADLWALHYFFEYGMFPARLQDQLTCLGRQHHLSDLTKRGRTDPVSS